MKPICQARLGRRTSTLADTGIEFPSPLNSLVLLSLALSRMASNGLQVVRRARNGAQHFRDGRLLLDEFGHPILQPRSGPFSVDPLVHAEQFLGLDGEGSITAPAAVRIVLTAVQTENAANTQRLLWVRLGPGAMSAQCPDFPKTDMAGRFMSTRPSSF